MIAPPASPSSLWRFGGSSCSHAAPGIAQDRARSPSGERRAIAPPFPRCRGCPGQQAAVQGPGGLVVGDAGPCAAAQGSLKRCCQAACRPPLPPLSCLPASLPDPHPLQLVELKNGETYNGHMVQCDTWMNIHLREVICTSKVGAATAGQACCCRHPSRCICPPACLQQILRTAATARCWMAVVMHCDMQPRRPPMLVSITGSAGCCPLYSQLHPTRPRPPARPFPPLLPLPCPCAAGWRPLLAHA